MCNMSKAEVNLTFIFNEALLNEKMGEMKKYAIRNGTEGHLRGRADVANWDAIRAEIEKRPEKANEYRVKAKEFTRMADVGVRARRMKDRTKEDSGPFYV